MVHHRRAGKDISVLNALTLAAYEEMGSYLYLLPEQTQGRKIIWRGLSGGETRPDGTRELGQKFTDYIPEAIIKKKYESEMLIELVNGSTIQIGGADNFNSFMGTNPRGIIFSEYSLMNPLAWQYFRPILVENGGWAAFIYTARGKNHGYDLANVAQRNPETWAYSLRTIEDTYKPDGTHVVTREQYEQEINDGMDKNIARQEFYCDFNAALIGSYYGDLMEDVRSSDRIGFYPYDPAKRVYTAYDLGNDANVCVFAQANGSGMHIIDSYEEVNTKFSEMCRVVSEKPYTYGSHFFPWDVVHRDPEGNTRLATAENYGIDAIVTPKYGVDDGIEAVRQLLPKLHFDRENTEHLRDCLMSYQRVWDDRLKAFKTRPLHDWSSHYSDAMRCLAMNADEVVDGDMWTQTPLQADLSYVV